MWTRRSGAAALADLAASVTPSLRCDRGGGESPRWSSPSLLGTLALMAVGENAGGARIISCKRCGAPAITKAHRGLYCSERCRTAVRDQGSERSRAPHTSPRPRKVSLSASEIWGAMSIFRDGEMRGRGPRHSHDVERWRRDRGASHCWRRSALTRRARPLTGLCKAANSVSEATSCCNRKILRAR